MKLEKFKEKDLKKRGILIGIGSVILLLAAIYLYKTFAIFEESQEFDVIKGQVPNQKYDVMLSYNIIDDSGNKTFQESIPEGTDWVITVECDHGATGTWDYNEWGPIISNLSNSRTKCSLNFKKPIGTMVEIIKNVPKVTSGNGLYEINHSDASITYTSDTTSINNLKQTELRYAGSSPNNYVTFNGETWRIIGLVNTPEGSRIKIIRQNSIGEYSWDSSASEVNGGTGVNEWSQADIMKLLNNEAYYNRTRGTCYKNSNNAKVSCDFSNTGLTTIAKSMIEAVTWNLGANPITDNDSLTPIAWYNAERGNVTGNNCNNGDRCNDNVIRTLTWNGRVGLMYPSDYGYATSDRSCLTKDMSSIETWNLSCYSNDWLYKSEENYFTITPMQNKSNANYVFRLEKERVVYGYASDGPHTHPTVYLKDSVRVSTGDGSSISPYELIP